MPNGPVLGPFEVKRPLGGSWAPALKSPPRSPEASLPSPFVGLGWQRAFEQGAEFFST